MEKNDKRNEAESLIAKFEHYTNPEDGTAVTELSDEIVDDIAREITDRESLEEGLPVLLDQQRVIKQGIDACAAQIKGWQESKKRQEKRSEWFGSVLKRLLENLNVPGRSLKANNIKLATSSRTSLEVDADWLIGQYQAKADALQAALPPFVKVKLDIDKNKLSAYLKEDNSLMLLNPEKMHFKESFSTTIK